MRAPNAGQVGQNRRCLHLGILLIVPFALMPTGCARWRSSPSAPAPPLLGTRWRDEDASGGRRLSLIQRLRGRNAAHARTVAASRGQTLRNQNDDPAESEALPPPVDTREPAQESGEIVEFTPTVQPLETDAASDTSELAAATPAPAEATTAPAAEAPPPAARGTSSRAAAPSMRQLVAAARSRLAGVKNYQVLMTRQERVGQSLQPQEDVVLSIRRAPHAVRLEWREGPHKGREVIYAADANRGLMHINMADSVVPVPRMSLPPDSPMVARTSRHPITEAGFDSILDKLEDSIERSEAGAAEGDRVSYAGREAVAQDGPVCDKIVRVTPTGETWSVYLSTETHLPTLVLETAGNGELLERYRFHDVKMDLPELADTKAFDPDGRWGAPRGFLQRLAGSGSEDSTAKKRTR